MANQTAGSKEFESINIKINKAIITSNEDESRTVDLRASDIVEYKEHMFRDTVEVSFIFSDTGNTLDGKSLSEALPLQTTENFEFEMQDARERKLKINLNVNKVTPIFKSQQKENILLTLTSEEFIRNEMYSSAVNERYDGKISDHVKSIVENNLNSKIKEENLEITANNFNFIGNKRKAFYIIRWLQKKCISVANGKMGDTAGFAFYQTSDGYHFKSIDSLFAQKTKRKYAFTGVADDVSQKYDAIVAKFSSNLNITANNKLRAGAYNTKLIVFDPFNCFYQVIDQDAEETKGGTTLAGKNLPVLNKKFTQETTRTTYMIKDTGTLPSGDVKQQIDKNEEETFEIEKILNQSIRRFNQLDCATMEIVIPTDFNLHVGETVRVDTRSLKNNTAGDGIDKTVSGKYLIFAVTHRVSNNKGSTKLGLVRDSIGRVAENTGMME